MHADTLLNPLGTGFAVSISVLVEFRVRQELEGVLGGLLIRCLHTLLRKLGLSLLCGGVADRLIQAAELWRRSHDGHLEGELLQKRLDAHKSPLCTLEPNGYGIVIIILYMYTVYAVMYCDAYGVCIWYMYMYIYMYIIYVLDYSLCIL